MPGVASVGEQRVRLRAAADGVRARPLLPLAGLVPLLAVLAWILVFRPYYGVEDDGTLLGLAHQDFWHTWWVHVRYDVTGWGMVRPYYWFLAWFEYRAGGHSPTVLYVLNWAATGGALALGGVALARAFEVPRPRRPTFLALYGAGVIGFPWTLDLFAFASLQEKWVILAAALGLLWFAEPRARRSPAAWYGVSAAVLVLGSMTKAQFLFFVPAFVLLTLDARRRAGIPWARVAFVGGLYAAIAAVLRVVAAHGSYTDQFGLQNVGSQLHSKYVPLFLVLGVGWTAYALRTRRPAGSTLRDLMPTAVLAAFIVAYVQWTGGLFSVIGFVAAGAFALAGSRLRPGLVATGVLVAALGASLAWSWIRAGELYGSLASIGEFARSSEVRAVAARGEPVFVSCEEGSGYLGTYAEWESGVSVRFDPGPGLPWAQARVTPPPGRFRWALVDAHLCPAAISGSDWRTVWTPSRAGGFTLYERRTAS
jgi:hypothetical protein